MMTLSVILRLHFLVDCQIMQIGFWMSYISVISDSSYGKPEPAMVVSWMAMSAGREASLLPLNSTELGMGNGQMTGRSY